MYGRECVCTNVCLCTYVCTSVYIRTYVCMYVVIRVCMCIPDRLPRWTVDTSRSHGVHPSTFDKISPCTTSRTPSHSFVLQVVTVDKRPREVRFTDS